MYLRNERPSMLHSQILNFALSFSKEHSDFSFYRFFMLWEPENLRYEDLNKGYYNGSEIPSLISRICRQIVNSGEDIDVEMLCEKINLPKTETLDLLREPQFWEIMNLHKEGKMREMFEAFTVYNKRNAVYGASHWHSEVLKIAERHMNGQETWRFIYFLEIGDMKTSWMLIGKKKQIIMVTLINLWLLKQQRSVMNISKNHTQEMQN